MLLVVMVVVMVLLLLSNLLSLIFLLLLRVFHERLDLGGDRERLLRRSLRLLLREGAREKHCRRCRRRRAALRLRAGHREQRRPPPALGESSEGVFARQTTLLLRVNDATPLRTGATRRRSSGERRRHFLFFCSFYFGANKRENHFCSGESLNRSSERMDSQNYRPKEGLDGPTDTPLSPPPPQDPQQPRRMRCITWNVNSLPPTARNAAMSMLSTNTASAVAAASSKSSSSSNSAFARATSAALARWLDERLNADVICLQETKFSEQKLKEAKELAVLKGYESFWSCSTAKQGYSGTGIYVCSPKWSPTACVADEALPEIHAFEHVPGGEAAVEALQPGLASSPKYLGEGRFLEISLGEDLTLINVYCPNAGDREADGGVRAGVKCAFLRALRRRVDDILAESKKQGKNRGVIVAGDFNIAPSRQDVCLDFDFAHLYSQEERSALQCLMAPPLVDAFRQMHPEATASVTVLGKRGFTVWDQRTNARSRDQGLRIDFFLVSDNLKIKRCEVLEKEVIPWPWSDHAALVLEVEEAPAGGGGEAAGTTAASAAAASSAAAAAPSSAPSPSSSSSPPLLLVRPPPPHEPVPQSSLKHPRWQPDPRQPTIAAMFGRKRAADDEAAEAAAAKKKEIR